MVNQKTLLLFAGIVWLVVGGNVLKIGLEAYQNQLNWGSLLLSILVFFLFWLLVFGPLTQKHQARILGYGEKQYFWRFFDGKAFVIMAVMITGGISIRRWHLLPASFIAFFYTGLGAALSLAGLLFLQKYFKERRKTNEKSHE
ncbi:hypothetical protein [Enterococcus sp. 2201sp1_2201st1_B8_2201SCRN_220225]|uniref:hypothetical protein n=1 Tax=unclassified Enterococcus TaxID=2608891 RepID=UPI0034A32BAE